MFTKCLQNLGVARGVMVIVIGNGHGDTSSNPGREWSHSTNTLGKDMNPIILPPAMQTRLFSLGKNSEFKPVKLRLKIDLVSEGLVNSIITKLCLGRRPRGVGANSVDCNIMVIEFELQSLYHDYTYQNSMKSVVLPGVGTYSTTTAPKTNNFASRFPIEGNELLTRSIWLIDGTLINTTTSSHQEQGNSGKISRTWASPSDAV